MKFFGSNISPEKKEVEIRVGLSVFGKTVIRKLPGSKRYKLIGEWRRIHKDKFRDLCFTTDVETITKSRMTR
jgi:hypothetical protein